jgi:hypothetical protein
VRTAHAPLCEGMLLGDKDAARRRRQVRERCQERLRPRPDLIDPAQGVATRHVLANARRVEGGADRVDAPPSQAATNASIVSPVRPTPSSESCAVASAVMTILRCGFPRRSANQLCWTGRRRWRELLLSATCAAVVDAPAEDVVLDAGAQSERRPQEPHGLEQRRSRGPGCSHGDPDPYVVGLPRIVGRGSETTGFAAPEVVTVTSVVAMLEAGRCGRCATSCLVCAGGCLPHPG